MTHIADRLITLLARAAAVGALFAANLPGPAAAAATPASAALPAGIEPITSVEGITEYRLNNGLKVLLFPDASKQTITVNITYLVGSRHESYGETGMAHLLEHLVFKGTPRHPNIPQELTEHGTRPNGTTSFDRTNYYETFAATEANLRWALDLEADRMVNSFIAKQDLDSEMTVVRNEFESGENNPGNVLSQRVLSTAYLWHNYGHSPIGSRADVENVPIDRLQNFYRTYYQPDNAVLLVAGKLEPAPTLAMIAQYFAVIPRPTRTLPQLYTAEPAQDGERSVTLRRVGDAQYVMVAYHAPSGAHPDAAALSLLTTVLGDAPSGRLYKSLVEPKLAANVAAFVYPLHDPGVVMLYAQVPRAANLEAARAALLQAVDALPREPITAAELERARAQDLKQIELGLNNSDRVGLALSNYIGMGDWRLYFLGRDRLRSATLADVQRVANQYLLAANRTVGLSYATDAPARVEVPANPDVVAMLKDYQGDAPKSEGEAFDPSPANIEARTLRSVLPVGLKLALLPKKTRGGAVNARLSLHIGDLASLSGQRTASNLTAAMLMRGSAQRTRQQLQDELDRLKARVTVGGGAGNVTASIETTRDNLPAVLALVAEVLRQPSFPESEFDTLRQERIAAIETQLKEPAALASNLLQRHMAPYPSGDIRYTATLAENLANLRAVTLAELRRFHQRFYGAAAGELTVVGDFDASALATQAAQLFQGWQSRQAYTRVPTEYHVVSALNQAIETPDKANAFLAAALNLPVRDDDAEYAALLLGNYMLGGGFLNSRLATRIRQKEGLSYGVGSQFGASPFDRAGTLGAFAIFAPENAARLEAALREELARVVNSEFTAEEIATAKTGWLQAQQVSRAQDGELAGKLNSYLYVERTLQWDAVLEAKVAALTTDDIKAAFARRVNPASFSVVRAGDFAKTAAAAQPPKSAVAAP